MSEQVRIDKWLWAARFFKTRSLAAEAIDRGRVKINEEHCKTSRNVHLDDLIDIDNGSAEWQVRVRGVSSQRGSATIARQLYEETAQSILRREQQVEQRRFFIEPAEALRGRPTKRDRRLLDRSK
jgi:ribosome-associated heat shock protein Hsp15